MSEHNTNQFALLRQRRFLPFFATQFLGAFNDNVFKYALIILIAFKGSEYSSVSPDVLTNLSAGLFILPFLVFSAVAGQVIEKYEKSITIQRIKLLEIIIMGGAALALYFESLYLLIALLFLMGAQSALFGPAKYSYIPQQVSADELTGANALVQSATFVAILTGTLCGGLLIAAESGEYLVAGAVLLLAIAGYVASLAIPVTPSHNSELVINWNLVSETGRTIRLLREDRLVFYCVIGVSWFWFLGATYLVQLPSYTKTTLAGDEQIVTLLLTLFTVGIGVGSMLCNLFWRVCNNLKLVIIGAAGLSIFGLDLYLGNANPVDETIGKELIGLAEFLATAGSYRVIIDVLCLGVFGGFYVVPLLTYVQRNIESAKLSRVIAGNNIFNALFMVASALMAMVLLGNGVSIAELFLVVAMMNIVVAVVIYKQVISRSS